MRLYLAVAALMLVLATHAEAQEEPTIEERFANFQTKLLEIGGDLSQKTIDAFKKIEESEFGTKTRNWFTEQFGKIKQKVDDTFSN